ncbi:ribulose-phosphate 3-epimerase [Candidatus Oleimmundimicrobium sp.]|uniref:ribulose-phosphate 3-epimerase n=1 Tax=Candidatus Oleimmundimicrobium sp. TaxID=3060597 RepID=UPI00271BFA55|nr:ribulose-phosphate 3-epimerase [Candidatus Oleimmundimicrobium sp.]MDO8885383.1 ribulose-phosphate 3-epimerase [Candidatus Oleimmundimicrobium sp.]
MLKFNKFIHKGMMMRKVKIAPSILSANFIKLGEEIKLAEKGGADYIHVDVMDGHFVPNITIGPQIVKSLNKETSIPLDVHLMIENPEFFIDDFVSAGADMISVHVEACTHLHRIIQKIKSFPNVKVGVALNPATALTSLVNILDEINFVVIMSVNPGFGGQKFIPQTIEKIKLLKNIINERNIPVEIEVDGGVNVENANEIFKAGADILVAGSSVFCKDDAKKAIADLRKAATA